MPGLFDDAEIPTIEKPGKEKKSGRGRNQGDPDPLTTTAAAARGADVPDAATPEKKGPPVDPAALPDIPQDEKDLLERIGEAPPPSVLQGKYPDNPKRKILKVSHAPGVWCSGFTMGFLYPTGCFVKLVQTKNIMQNPPALGFDAGTMAQYKGTIKALAVYDKDSQIWYTVSGTVFYEKKMVTGRGKAGVQYVLPLSYWKSHDCKPKEPKE